MSDTLKSNPIINKPKSVKEIKNDIQGKEVAADYTRKNILCWVVLFLVIISAVCVTFTFLWRFFTDTVVQNYVIDQIKNNIVFLIISALAILKINLPKNN